MTHTPEHKIQRFLRQLRRRRTLQSTLIASALWLIGASISLLLLLVLARVGWLEQLKGPVALVLAALPLCVVLGGIFTLRRQKHPLTVALWVERREPELRGYLLSAVEFLQRPLRSGESPEMAAQVIEETARKISSLRPREIVPIRLPRWASLPAFPLALLVTVSFLLFPPPPEVLRPPIRTDRFDAVPVVGDLFVRYEYPKYTNLPPQEIDGLSGAISALKGTRIALKTRADREVINARIVFDGKETIIPLKVREGRTLEGEFPLLESGSYRFVLEEEGGQTVVGVPREMKIEEDLPPQVMILSPGEEMEVHEDDLLDIEVSVQDDFRLTSLRTVFQIEGLSTPQVFEVEVFTEPRQSFHGVLHQPLSALNLREGDRVRYTVEALDNDAVSGPKRGVSAPRYLKVFSAKERHEELIDLQDRLVDELVSHLGARIENPFPPVLPGEAAPAADPEGEGARAAEALSQLSLAGEKLMGEADHLAGALADDPLSHPEVTEALRTIALHLNKQARSDREIVKDLRGALSGSGVSLSLLKTARQKNEEAITELESDIIALEELVNRQRAEELRAIGQELSAARDRLRELLEAYEKTQDPALKAQIEREIERIEADMRRFQEKLARMRQEIPDEFYNLEALEPDEMKEGLSQVKDLLAKGDISGARKALEALSQALEATTAELDAEAARFADKESQERDRALEDLSQKIALLEEKEQELKQETQDIEERARSRGEEAKKETIQKAKESALKKVEKILALLEGEIAQETLSEGSQKERRAAKEIAEALQKALGEEGIFLALDAARALVDALLVLEESVSEDISREELRNDIFGRLASLRIAKKGASEARKLAEEIVKELEKAAPRPEDYLSGDERAELERLAREQQKLQEELEGLAEAMEALEEKIPGAKATAGPPLEEASEAMKEAGAALKKHSPRKAAEAEAEALAKLKEFRQKLKQAGRPEGSAKRLRDPKEVKIPKAEEYKPPKDFREEVMEGAREKDKAPPRFQDAIKKYYEELLR